MAAMKPIRIFRAGQQTDAHGNTIEFTDADLQASAAAYDPDKHNAPLVIGHPSTDDPAFGWLQSLSYAAPFLEAVPTQVNREFAELVNSGAYKFVSVAFYPKQHPHNPVPEVYYPRHLGFLGATPPAVKGLGPVQFDEDADDDLLIIQFAESDFNDPPEETPVPENTENTPNANALAAREAELNQRQVDLDAREQAQVQREQTAQRTEIAAFADQLGKEGRILPRQQALVAELIYASSDNAADNTLQFGEGDNAHNGTPRALLRQFLSELPVQVAYAEIAAAEQLSSDALPAYQPPHGYSVDPHQAKLHHQALAYAEQHKVDYFVAVEAVQRQGVK